MTSRTETLGDIPVSPGIIPIMSLEGHRGAGTTITALSMALMMKVHSIREERDFGVFTDLKFEHADYSSKSIIRQLVSFIPEWLPRPIQDPLPRGVIVLDAPHLFHEPIGGEPITDNHIRALLERLAQRRVGLILVCRSGPGELPDPLQDSLTLTASCRPVKPGREVEVLMRTHNPIRRCRRIFRGLEDLWGMYEAER
ncbi:MAG: hypothetical protein J4F40_18630 [Alphaproteobacteria bacterium]|nr:hypothetical protein [Alphaproteobacteria bacterium]